MCLDDSKNHSGKNFISLTILQVHGSQKSGPKKCQVLLLNEKQFPMNRVLNFFYCIRTNASWDSVLSWKIFSLDFYLRQYSQSLQFMKMFRYFEKHKTCSISFWISKKRMKWYQLQMQGFWKGALYVGHHGWPKKKILGFRWFKKAEITLETIIFWQNIFLSVFSIFLHFYW